MNAHNLKELLTALLAWYEHAGRELPWRTSPAGIRRGERPDPYRVWLSEVMLQQTTVVHAARHYSDFTGRWPTVEALAAAEWMDVAAAWAGLGYYSRARNLHACAKLVAEAGGFPQEADALQGMPGIGPYTAAAVAAIAFDRPVLPVDGNIERVASRLYAIGGDGSPAGWRRDKQAISARAADLAGAFGGEAGPDFRPGDAAQALMDIGALVCTPRAPACGRCPLAPFCEAHRQGRPEAFPVKPARAARPLRRGWMLVLEREGQVLTGRRPPRGLLGGMRCPPGSPWAEASPALIPIAGARRVGDIRHVFTHFALMLDVWLVYGSDTVPAGMAAAPLVEAGAEPLEAWAFVDWAQAIAEAPSVAAKALRLARAEGAGC